MLLLGIRGNRTATLPTRISINHLNQKTRPHEPYINTATNTRVNRQRHIYYDSIIILLYIHVPHHHIPRSSTSPASTTDFSREKMTFDDDDHGHKNAPIAKTLFSSTLPFKLNPYCFRSNSTFHSSMLSYSSLV